MTFHKEKTQRREARLETLIAQGNRAGIMGLFDALYESGEKREIEYLVSLHPDNERVEKIAIAVFDYYESDQDYT